ncbi:hypothetical protein HHUSO_G4263, partial [Huso huso]
MAAQQQQLTAKQALTQQQIDSQERRHQEQQAVTQQLMAELVKERGAREEMEQRTSTMGATSSVTNPIKPSHLLSKMTLQDDVEVYLLAFERIAAREYWPKAQWTGSLATFLIGNAQKVYFHLGTPKGEYYEQLMVEILAKEGVALAVRAQRFHAWAYNPEQARRSQMYGQVHLTKRWLQPEVNSANHVLEILVMDWFLTAMPASLRKWVGQGDPSNLDKFVALVERQIAAVDHAQASSATSPKSIRQTPPPRQCPGLNSGKKNVIKYDIVTEPSIKVKLHPYRVPEAKRAKVIAEVEKMLQLDVIEEPNSEWTSPVVLVPKPNGTW